MAAPFPLAALVLHRDWFGRCAFPPKLVAVLGLCTAQYMQVSADMQVPADMALADSQSDKFEIDLLRAEADAKAAELAALIQQLELWQWEVNAAEVRAVAYATSNGAWSHAPCCSGSLGGPQCSRGRCSRPPDTS